MLFWGANLHDFAPTALEGQLSELCIMGNINLEQNNGIADTEIWNSLQEAIAASSGFLRWQLEAGAKFQNLRLEEQVQRYLRETLENLAY